MKRLSIRPVTLIVIALSFIACNKQPSPHLLMRWQHLENDVQTGICESKFTIVNLSDDTLSNWQVFYNQMSIAPLHNDSALLNIIQIQASYHTLVPTANNLLLAPHDSIQQIVRYRGTIMRKSGCPNGPFVVLDNGQIEDVTLQCIYSDDAHEFRRKIPTFPYADGEWMYQQNQRFNQYTYDLQPTTYDLRPTTYDPLHLLPTPKQISYIKGSNTNLTTSHKQTSIDPTLPLDGYRILAYNDSLIISANNDRGLFYANQTIIKLKENNGNQIPPCEILDYPDIAHRGFMLDIARNFTPKHEILRLIDILASYKMNVLHLHLTDDEGWRIEIPDLPELTEVGSHRGYTTDEHDCLYPMYSGGWNSNDPTASANGYLTRQDFIDILKYAKQRYIDIVPEIDMPGHSRAAIKSMEARYFKYIDTDSLKACKYLLSDFNDTSKYVSAQHYTDNVICIALPSCYTFAKKVIDEVMLMYKEADAPIHIFHVGGDEVPRGAWLGSPKVEEYVVGRRSMENDNTINLHTATTTTSVTAVDVANLKDAFLESIIAILDEYGLQIAGWEEIAYRGGQPNPRFANRNAMTYTWNSVPEWRGDEKPYILANAGYPVMVCCVTNLYLDMCYLNHEEEQGLNWGGYVDEYQSFLLRPNDLYRSVERTMLGKSRDLNEYANSDKTALNPDAAPNIRGIQAQLWAETIRNSEQLETYLFPKLLGVAERAWNADFDFSQKEQLLQAYNRQLWQYEIPSLNNKGIAFHITQPGIHRSEDDTVSMNTALCGIDSAEIHYTTDGTEPTLQSPLYTTPFHCTAPLINAAVFYLGRHSNTTHQIK